MAAGDALTLAAPGVAAALGAAVLFGLSTPAAKLLVGSASPTLVAGLLYLGSGLGLGAWLLGRRLVRAPATEALPGRGDLPCLGAIVVTGGVVGPLLLMLALGHGSSAQASLLLNLEGVLTVLLAWLVFREHVSARIVAGMAAIAAGGAALAWDGPGRFAFDHSVLLVAGASLAWAIDNNLTRTLSASDPIVIAAVKGLAAGPVNIAIAAGGGTPWPPLSLTLVIGLVGVLGYGVSLTLFVVALRHVGAARTVAYFSTAPFVGAAGGIVVLGEPLTLPLGSAAALMAVGVVLHVTEAHAHEHVHEALGHEHRHHHDEHHRHDHADGDATGPHTHPHVHAPLRHRHPHFPDLHHRHPH